MPAVGSIVLYVLSERDCLSIEAQRHGSPDESGAPVFVGQQVPLVVVEVTGGAQDPTGAVAGQAILNGTDTLWVRLAPPSATPEPGYWLRAS